ncbi:MAG: T9SS type A sorting domain-containing protein, partial [Bacteroidota bacterium]
PSTNTAFYPQSSNDWCGGSYGVGCYSIDLTAWAGKPDIKVMFESFTFFGNNLFLNDIRVNGTVGVQEHKINAASFTLYPNPSAGQFVLSVVNGQQEAVIQVVNPQGVIISSERILLKSGSCQQHLDLSGAPKGVYFIRVTDALSTQVQKLILE